tara:strand:- start:106 stop:726 length:621 start_codon:yes stop_codon:yes gene_type:complete
VIKLKELLYLDELTYNDGPKDKHQKRINNPITLFENKTPIPHIQPPDNSSKQTLDELKYLQKQRLNRKFVEMHDDVTKVFSDLAERLGVEFDKDESEKILKESAKYIMELKYKYNRPRPYQVAKFYNMDVTNFNMDSMNTPSYPSGHATQGCLMGKICSDKYPEYRKEFTELGKDIGDSRIIAKAHYPSDQRYGIKLAETLFDNLK